MLSANALSLCGSAMSVLAVPWFVLQTTGSAAKTGLVAGVEMAGTAAAALLGAPLVDRLGRRVSSALSDLCGAAAVGAIPLLWATVGLPFGVLLLLTALVGLLTSPGTMARASMMPALVARAGIPAERGAGAYDGASRGARMLGAPLAGVLIAGFGPGAVLIIDATTFVLSAVLVAALVPSSPGGRAATGYLHRLRGGLDYLRDDRLMRAILWLLVLLNLLDAAWMSVLLPVYAQQVFDSSVALGLMLGFFAAGGLAGTVAFAWIGARLPRRQTFLLAFLISGAPRFAVLAVQTSLATHLVVLTLCGVAVGALNPILSVTQYERVPDEMRPMAIGVLNAGALGGIPAGALLGGLAVETVGAYSTAAAIGVLYLVITAIPFVLPVWRGLDRAAVPASA
ncbi:MFS transporter [Actinokineospora auranticolor]|uniref:MFS transporter n=1 Tax=Actinokineospora auranticolor TaxID=155976 RepID=UPI0011B06A65|nr:MFS transporter [Actinokineospora auranticolor]